MKASKLPAGWDEKGIQDLVDYYDTQTDEQAAAEHEAALANPKCTLMEVPTELVPVFRELIAKHGHEARNRK